MKPEESVRRFWRRWRQWLRLVGPLGPWRRRQRFGGRRRVRRRRAIVRQADRQQQIRFMRPPAIADSEIERLRALKQDGIRLLILVGEFRDRAGITAEREEAPLPGAVVAKRNSGIVLNDGGAVGENEIAHRREAAGMQQIRRALEQAVAGRKRGAEFQKAA